jgi:hypothetical protein
MIPAAFGDAPVRQDSLLDGSRDGPRAPQGEAPVAKDPPSQARSALAVASLAGPHAFRVIFHPSHPAVVIAVVARLRNRTTRTPDGHST